MTTTRRQFVQALGASAALGAFHPFAANAQVDQVKVYFGFPAGSSGDTVARRVAEKWAGSAFSKNPGVVENKPGAGGRIALETLKAAPADGSVLAVAQVSALANYPHIYSKMNYTDKDFAPVSIAAIMHHGLAVGPMVPASVKTVKDFLAWAKANPKDASYGSPGAGSTPHFLGALLGINSGVDLRHVPYRGSIPGVTDVVGGQVAAMVTPHGDFIANYKAGKLRILATSGPKRSIYVPDVPTFAEAGGGNYSADVWYGVLAPAGLPEPIALALERTAADFAKSASAIDRLRGLGLDAESVCGNAFASRVAREVTTYSQMAKALDLKAD